MVTYRGKLPIRGCAAWEAGRSQHSVRLIAMTSEVAQGAEMQTGRQGAEREVERLLLDAAGALQRLVAERDALKARVETQERELNRLQEHIALFHDSYRRLTSEFIAQSQLIDGAVSRFVGAKAAEIQPFKTEPETRSDG
jgi:hypothetical protein